MIASNPKAIETRERIVRLVNSRSVRDRVADPSPCATSLRRLNGPVDLRHDFPAIPSASGNENSSEMLAPYCARSDQTADVIPHPPSWRSNPYDDVRFENTEACCRSGHRPCRNLRGAWAVPPAP